MGERREEAGSTIRSGRVRRLRMGADIRVQLAQYPGRCAGFPTTDATISDAESRRFHTGAATVIFGANSSRNQRSRLLTDR
jgi:hypothetical protein